jgi:hypothetical protein
VAAEKSSYVILINKRIKISNDQLVHLLFLPIEMMPSLGGKPPQRGTRVGGLLSVSGCSGGGAPLTGGEGDRRGPLVAD